MTGPVGGADEDPGPPTAYVRDVNGGPLGGGGGGPRALTINTKKFNGGSPGRWCRRSESTHNQSKKCRWRPPWEAVTETQERPPPLSETSMAGPMGGADGDSGAPTTYVGDIDGGPLWILVLEVRERSP
jgi:hypothetical protein